MLPEDTCEHPRKGRSSDDAARGYLRDVLRTGAVVLSAVAGVGAALCFMHHPSVTVDGEQRHCRGVTLFGEMAAELGDVDTTWRPRECEEEYHRWMAYAGGLGLLSAFAGTGAAFYRREDDPTAAGV